MSEDGDEWEEEETLVLVELSGILESDFKNRVDKSCKLLGLGTDTPMLEFDNYTFSGHYEDTLGGCLLFEDKGPKEEKVEHSESELFQKLLRGSNKSPTRDIEYSCHVTKKLVMARAFLAKDAKEDDPKNNDNGEGKYVTRKAGKDSELKFSQKFDILPMLYDQDDEISLTPSAGPSTTETNTNESQNTSETENSNPPS